MPRIPVIPEEELDADLLGFVSRATLQEGPPLNFFLVLAHHPKLLEKWTVFAARVLGKSSLPIRHRETLVLRTVWNCGAEYEWVHHVDLDRGLGFTDEDFERIKEGPEAAGLPDLERLLLRAADELHAQFTLTDQTFDRLRKHYGYAEVLEIIFLVGNYHLVSFFVRAASVPLEPGLSDQA